MVEPFVFSSGCQNERKPHYIALLEEQLTQYNAKHATTPVAAVDNLCGGRHCARTLGPDRGNQSSRRMQDRGWLIAGSPADVFDPRKASHSNPRFPLRQISGKLLYVFRNQDARENQGLCLIRQLDLEGKTPRAISSFLHLPSYNASILVGQWWLVLRE